MAHAFKSMAELEAGAISNPDERRMVGHYWLRKPELAPNRTLEKEIRDTLDEVNAFAQGVLKGEVRTGKNERKNG